MGTDKLKGIHALITGASSGLGLAMAEALLREGASVVLTARRADPLNLEIKRLRDEGLDAYGVSMDVRDEHSIEKAVEWVRQEWGQLQVLVNNAGIGMRTVNPTFLVNPQPFYQVTPDGFRNLIDTNLTGYFLVARAFVSLFLEQGQGRIINISMNYETMKRKGFIPYGPSRAGAESLSLIMAEDLRGTGITVNMLLPGGATETGMIPEDLKQAVQFPLLKPEIMAKPIVFLSSPEAAQITGERVVATEFEEWLNAR